MVPICRQECFSFLRYYWVMGKYFITGREGSGKITVIKVLQGRGFTAYNTDDLPETTKLQNKETGKVIPWSET